MGYAAVMVNNPQENTVQFAPHALDADPQTRRERTLTLVCWTHSALLPPTSTALACAGATSGVFVGLTLSRYAAKSSLRMGARIISATTRGSFVLSRSSCT